MAVLVQGSANCSSTDSGTRCLDAAQKTTNHSTSPKLQCLKTQEDSSLQASCPEPRDFSPLYAGRFTKVKSIGDSAHGKVLLCRMHAQGQNDQPVMVKKMENSSLDAALAGDLSHGVSNPLVEIAVLMKLTANQSRCPFLIDLIDVARDNTHTLIVTKHCNEGALFDVVCRDENSGEAKLKRYLWQLLQATKHLHTNNIGHQNISVEAILVDDGELRLADFGQAVKLSTSDDKGELKEAIHYSHICGSRYYRAPECYPNAKDVAPDQGPTWSYEARPVDVFACGAVLFVLHARRPPWQFALPCDSSFALMSERGVEQLLPGQLLSETGMALLNGMLQPEPAARLSVEEALSSPWFDFM